MSGIEVTLDESPRTYIVRIGHKVIGKIVSYGSGYMETHVHDPSALTNFRFVHMNDVPRSLLAATRLIAKEQGFGRKLDISRVERIPAGRIR